MWLCTRERLLLFDELAFSASRSLFFFFCVRKYISSVFWYFVKPRTPTPTQHVGTFSISTKRFISSYILFTRWHSQFVSIGLQSDHKVLHTLPHSSACTRVCVSVCKCSSFSILFRNCFLSTLFRSQPFIAYRCLHMYVMPLEFSVSQRDFICFACNPYATAIAIYAALRSKPSNGICACVLIKWPQKSLLIKLKNCESFLLLHLNYSTDVFYMYTSTHARILCSKGYYFDRK